IAVSLVSLNTLSTAGAKLVSVVNNTTEKLAIDLNGKLVHADYTDISGSPGNGTANAVCGRAAIASGAQTCVVTNSRVTATSIIKIQMETAGTGVGNIIVTAKSAGTSFTVTSINGTGAA